jgi:hypothetical protein
MVGMGVDSKRDGQMREVASKRPDNSESVPAPYDVSGGWKLNRSSAYAN